jgi:DEAD/DEAH box helicase domain-containing protein
VAAVVARLRRLCELAGSDPAFIVSSATLGDPAGSAAQLLGVPAESVVAIADDASARGPRTVVLLDPTNAAADHEATVPPDRAESDRPAGPRTAAPLTWDQARASGNPDTEAAEAQSAFGATAKVLSSWASAGIRSVGFLRSRAGVEAMAQQVRATGQLSEQAVTAYRGGLLPEERRDIERRLRSGELRCVASTNALELGVDIAGLDAVAMCGWPGTRLSFLQQLGRAGRTGEHAVAVLAAQADPLDRFYAHHPERIFSAPVEATVLDRSNPYVLIGHVACAVAEQPLSAAEGAAVFGPAFHAVVSALETKGLVRLRGDRWFWVAREPAHTYSDLRGCGQPVTIIEAETGRVMGSVDGSSAPAQLHPGAVYTHLGVTHLIESLDLVEGVAVACPARPGYTTVAQTVSDLRVRGASTWRPSGCGVLHRGEVEVTSQVVGYLKRAAATGRVLGSHPLDLPQQKLVTRAVWWRISESELLASGVGATEIPGAAHAAEHAAIGVLPALATCDRWDIGGLSTALHPDTGEVTVFVYDGHPGGAGYARRAYDRASEWLRATRNVVASCDCTAGCPGCVQSPKCGNGNEPLHKAGAVTMLDLLLSGR